MMNKLKKVIAAVMSAIMCVSACNCAVYATDTELPEGATIINIAELAVSDKDANGDGRNEREYIITEDGVYLLTGSNFNSGTYTTTHIEVATGVTATIYLQNFSIYNDDGLVMAIYGPDDPVPDSWDATNPIAINAGSDVKLCLLSDAEFSINEEGSVFCVEEGARVTLEPSAYQLKLSDTLSDSKMSDPPTLFCIAAGIVNGSDGMLYPANTATRAEAVMFQRFCEKVIG